MGSYTFTWAHDASEVYVTGDFDSWKKTVKLEKEDGVFQKSVELPKQKHQYKFVVDGNWVTNDSHPKEDDGNGNFNNVLYPEDVKEPVSTLSSAAPESTTAALAGGVPKEERSKSDDSIPGAFPLTPPAATPGSEPQAFSVNPIPATAGLGNPITLAPGEKVPDPSTLTDNTVQSTVKDDKEPEEEKVSVAPIPATAGPGNPVHLAPGEKVPDPSTLTENTISSTAKTDVASYEKSDALPPQLAPVVTPEAEREAKGDPGVTIQSAAPTSTTAALAGEVPKEPKTETVPEAVIESQKEANFPPEATANPEAVEEKKEVEAELKQKVPEEPAINESSVTDKIAAGAAAGAAAVGATVAAGATYLNYSGDKEKETKALNGQPTASDVPEVVAESQKEAHASPEASANKEAVEEKKEVEAQLLKEVKPTNETGEPAPAITAATTETAPKTETAAAPVVPEVVAESQKEAHASPEASANKEAVEEKKQVEAELLKEVKTVTESGEPAPTVTAATSETAPALSDDALTDAKPLKSSSEPDALNAPASAPAQPLPVPEEPVDSRDVSPMSKQPTRATTQNEPEVTTGVESSKTASKTEAKTPETPKKDAPSSAKATPESVASGTTDKKKKRTSFFGKLKAKLKDL